MFNYLRDPEKIEKQTFDKIREITPLDEFTDDQKQVVLHLVRACGEPLLAGKIRFSPQAIESAKKAIKHYAYILYDFDNVSSGLDSRLLTQEPLSFVQRAVVISQAKAKKQTRSMTSVNYWRKYLAGSICLLGHSSTALFRLLEILQEEGAAMPALVIATPAGFINTTEAKQSLMDHYEELGLEYILIEGHWGGSMFASEAMNALMKIQKGIYV